MEKDFESTVDFFSLKQKKREESMDYQHTQVITHCKLD